ncbi:MAG TPA: hypothetical protein DEP48_03315 [Persephonella sp.]|uniref:Hypothetical M protein n=1 Tax=Persephonella marina (strain DSM 14350 / EX-H1) TaxID=123214 RepID=C0QSH5_PERMH|nr:MULTISPECIES: hypothetical protein [Persephonella]ACO03510.1 hypothetical M protein [Persephonella marina EX-H1]HCB69368.1 hypothetical protein [Persephonella sp.]
MKNKILENILIEERERLLGRLKAIEHRLKSLPSGWIREIKKENKTYKYLYQSKREGKKVKSIFVGKVDENLEKQINERRKLIEEKKQLKERVKELNKILELY